MKTLPDLPGEVLEKIAGYTGIDARRAMGFPPRRIPPDELRRLHARIASRIVPCSLPMSTIKRWAMIHRMRAFKYYIIFQNPDDGPYREVWLCNRYHYTLDQNKETHVQCSDDGRCWQLTRGMPKEARYDIAGPCFRPRISDEPLWNWYAHRYLGGQELTPRELLDEMRDSKAPPPAHHYTTNLYIP